MGRWPKSRFLKACTSMDSMRFCFVEVLEKRVGFGWRPTQMPSN